MAKKVTVKKVSAKSKEGRKAAKTVSTSLEDRFKKATKKSKDRIDEFKKRQATRMNDYRAKQASDLMIKDEEETMRLEKLKKLLHLE